MALNALEMNFFEGLLRGANRNTKALTEITPTPDQLADELKAHAQKELDAQWIQNPFTLDDLPTDAFQRRQSTDNDDNNDDDDDDNPNTPKKPKKLPPILTPALPQRVKQWLG